MAAAWLAQRDEGLTAEEQADFTRWQRADPRHAAAVARLEQTWAALQRLREFRPASRVHPDPDLLVRARPPGRVISFPLAAALAGVAAAAVIAVMLWRGTPAAPTPAPGPPAAAPATVYATTADGYQRVVLADGSVLELNASSEAQVEFLPAERHVRLVRGEAHFTVAKNPRRPFVVQAGPVAVRAVGTAFNVRLAPQEVEVLVTEGRVRVEHGAAAAGPVPELAARQRLVVTTPAGAAPGFADVETLPTESVQATLAWQGPRLNFADTPLASVVAQFNRHNRIQIELGDARLASVPVDGSFRAENVEAFVRLLESNRSVQVDRTGPDRIILRRAP